MENKIKLSRADAIQFARTEKERIQSLKGKRIIVDNVTGRRKSEETWEVDIEFSKQCLSHGWN